jgi:undecaprenyl-diphosphatase
MLDSIISFDRNLFLALNGNHSPLLDTIMFVVADRFVWIPVYLFLAFILYRKFGNQALFMILFAAILITLSDQGSVLMKDIFQRLRPCHDSSLALMVHTVGGRCGGQYGFVSSHAANTMALFTYLFIFTRNSSKILTWSLAFWVLLIGYCRIYLGVHYPADIIGGWVVGIVAAVLTYIIYRSIFSSPVITMNK